MNRSKNTKTTSIPKPTGHLQSNSRQTKAPTPNIETIEVIPPNSASDAKIALIEEKRKELDELVKLKNASNEMVLYFFKLSNSIKGLAQGAHDVAETLENWDTIFGIMGEMNTGGDPASEKWVRMNARDYQHNAVPEKRRRV